MAVLVVSARAFFAARSHVGCALRILGGAPPGDSSPPAMYGRLASAFWQHRDLYLARMLAQECTTGSPGGIRKAQRQLFALTVVKTRLSPSQREALGAVLLRAPDGGRGLTRLAQAEWGRRPAGLNEQEMTWLFVIGQLGPGCSRQRALSEPDRQVCASRYQSLLAELPRLQPSASQK
ncbi:MAG TPA: hypothetical protein VF179_08000 [Thermoanaerobaculia bacterium]|nr:hypothetical protein [Thermoanaerobaculia bacterium]